MTKEEYLLSIGYKRSGNLFVKDAHGGLYEQQIDLSSKMYYVIPHFGAFLESDLSAVRQIFDDLKEDYEETAKLNSDIFEILKEKLSYIGFDLQEQAANPAMLTTIYTFIRDNKEHKIKLYICCNNNGLYVVKNIDISFYADTSTICDDFNYRWVNVNVCMTNVSEALKNVNSKMTTNH